MKDRSNPVLLLSCSPGLQDHSFVSGLVTAFNLSTMACDVTYSSGQICRLGEKS